MLQAHRKAMCQMLRPDPEAAITVLQAGVQFRDPHECTDSADTLALTEAVFDAPVRRGQDGRFLPALAKRWSVSEDARTWTFELRTGVRFHDGTEFDARAMLRSVERMQRPDVGATLGASAVWAQYLTNAKLDAPDERTLRIITTEPSAYLLDILVSAYAVPPELVERDDFAHSPVGTGERAAPEIHPKVVSPRPGHGKGCFQHGLPSWAWQTCRRPGRSC